MSPTAHEVRNAIRVATGRFERESGASFTKEESPAICEALEVDVGEAGRPSTTRIRRLIRARVGISDPLEAADDSTFRKGEPQAIADGVGRSSEL
jgi:hypothetical protein